MFAESPGQALVLAAAVASGMAVAWAAPPDRKLRAQVETASAMAGRVWAPAAAAAQCWPRASSATTHSELMLCRLTGPGPVMRSMAAVRAVALRWPVFVPA